VAGDSARLCTHVRVDVVYSRTEEKLIRIKAAAGRRKDLEAIAELRVLLEEIDKKQT
jgi:hypothetical protein